MRAVRVERSAVGPTRVRCADAFLVAPLPPPVSGQALAAETLLSELEDLYGSVEVFDTARAIESSRSRVSYGLRSLSLFVRFVAFLLRWWRVRNRVWFYHLAHGPLGMVRDAVLLTALKYSRARPVLVGQIHGDLSLEDVEAIPFFAIQRLYRRRQLDFTLVLVLGEELRQRARAAWPEGHRTAFEILPNAVDGMFLTPTTPPPETDAGLSVIHVGNLCHLKGTLAVLEVATRSKCGIRSVSLIGQVSCEEVRSRLESHDVQKAIGELRILPPRVGSRTEIVEALDSAHVLVLPSATEGQPLVLLEAMSRGRAVLASSAGGIPETVDDPRQVLDGHDLADAMCRRLSEWASAPSILNEVFRRNRSRIESRFSPTSFRAGLCGVLQEHSLI